MILYEALFLNLLAALIIILSLFMNHIFLHHANILNIDVFLFINYYLFYDIAYNDSYHVFFPL